MSESGSLMALVNWVVRLLPPLAILAGCVVYLVRTKSVEGVLLVAGEGLAFLGGLLSFGLVVTQGAYTPTYVSAMQTLYLLGGALFAVGFLMMAFKQRRAVPATTPATTADLEPLDPPAAR